MRVGRGGGVVLEEKREEIREGEWRMENGEGEERRKEERKREENKRQY